MGTRIGLAADTVPNITFQLFRNQNQTALAISPFHLGEQPNIRFGVAKVRCQAGQLTSIEIPKRTVQRSP